MSDRELLELAAKAAGYDKTMESFGFCDNTGRWVEYAKNIYWHNGKECREYWNPLTDDGDALRLAVKLQIYVMVVPEQNQVNARVRNGARSFYLEPMNDDPYAATRRAIVRAAAEVGRTIQ